MYKTPIVIPVRHSHVNRWSWPCQPTAPFAWLSYTVYIHVPELQTLADRERWSSRGRAASTTADEWEAMAVLATVEQLPG